jgi:hypothetical protein
MNSVDEINAVIEDLNSVKFGSLGDEATPRGSSS